MIGTFIVSKVKDLQLAKSHQIGKYGEMQGKYRMVYAYAKFLKLFFKQAKRNALKEANISEHRILTLTLSMRFPADKKNLKPYFWLNYMKLNA